MTTITSVLLAVLTASEGLYAASQDSFGYSTEVHRVVSTGVVEILTSGSCPEPSSTVVAGRCRFVLQEGLRRSGDRFVPGDYHGVGRAQFAWWSPGRLIVVAPSRTAVCPSGTGWRRNSTFVVNGQSWESCNFNVGVEGDRFIRGDFDYYRGADFGVVRSSAKAVYLYASGRLGNSLVGCPTNFTADASRAGLCKLATSLADDSYSFVDGDLTGDGLSDAIFKSRENGYWYVFPSSGRCESNPVLGPTSGGRCRFSFGGGDHSAFVVKLAFGAETPVVFNPDNGRISIRVRSQQPCPAAFVGTGNNNCESILRDNRSARVVLVNFGSLQKVAVRTISSGVVTYTTAVGASEGTLSAPWRYVGNGVVNDTRLFSVTF